MRIRVVFKTSLVAAILTFATSFGSPAYAIAIGLLANAGTVDPNVFWNFRIGSVTRFAPPGLKLAR